MIIDEELRLRYWTEEQGCPDSERDAYAIDKKRVINSSAFRGLKGKAQILGVTELHRTRFSHSVKVAQIAERLLLAMGCQYPRNREVHDWLPSRSLMTAACLAHDLGHPPFGHAGEKALHCRMVDYGGFEGNGQTLRIVTRLEKVNSDGGINPTRRLILALLKYPIRYSAFDKIKYSDNPPKCYFDTEAVFVEWALGKKPFTDVEFRTFVNEGRCSGNSKYQTLDCSIMEYADDVEFGVHDLEDIVARDMVCSEVLIEGLESTFHEYGPRIGSNEYSISLSDFKTDLSVDTISRGALFCKLINLFTTSAQLKQNGEFDHPLLRLQLDFDESTKALLEKFKELTYRQVIQRVDIQERQQRGQRIIQRLFDELMITPEKSIPPDIWKTYSRDDGNERKVCDYIAGMTDLCVEKMSHRLYIAD